MNRIGIAVVMLLIAGIICGFEIFTVNGNVESYNQELDTISKLMSEENFSEAEVLSEKVLINWRKTARNLDKYLYHDYIDNITEEISALPVYAKAEDKSAVKSQVEQIKIQLASLKESELPYMHNIL